MGRLRTTQPPAPRPSRPSGSGTINYASPLATVRASAHMAWSVGHGCRRKEKGALVPDGDDAFAWLPRRDQDGIAARRSGSTRPSSSQDLVVCGEAPRVLVEGGIWDDKAWGSVLGCVGSTPERVEGSAGQGRQADERAGLLIMGAWDACSHEASQDRRMVCGQS